MTRPLARVRNAVAQGGKAFKTVCAYSTATQVKIARKSLNTPNTSNEQLNEVLAFDVRFKRRRATMGMVFFGILGLLPLGLFVAMVLDSGYRSDHLIILAFPLMMLLLVGLFGYLRSAAGEVRQRLESEPDQVVWVYLKDVYSSGIHAGTFVRIAFADGTEVGINTSKQYPPGLVMQLLAQRCPRATFGYSEENAQMFRTDPTFLRT